MFYIEIQKISLRNDELKSPAAYLAAMTQNQDTVEFRIQRYKGSLHCFIGVETCIQALKLKSICSELRYGIAIAEHVPEITTTVLLMRRITETVQIHPGQIADRQLHIKEIKSDPLRISQMCFTLNQLPEGCGYSIFIRPAKRVNGTMAVKEQDGHNILQNIYEEESFQACCCLFANEENQIELLKDEMMFALPGLTAYEINRINVNTKNIWDSLAPIQALFKGKEVKTAISTFLYSEVEALSSMVGMQHNAFQKNRDTLFPKQREERKVENPFITIGFSEDGKPQTLSLKDLKKHMFIAGAPGTGKGNLIFYIAEQLYHHRVPILLIESAKQEQHHLRKRIPDLNTWRPESGKFLLNPFALPPDVTVGSYRSALLQILQVCFKSDGPLEELYGTTLSRCFAKYGYSEDSQLNTPGTIPFGLSEFITEFNKLLRTNGYSERAKQDIRTAGVTRLRSLIDQNADVFDTIHSIPITELIHGSNLIQLNSLTTVESKQMFATILLISLGTWLRLNAKHSQTLQLVVILDESHNLLRAVEDTNGKQFSFTSDFENLLLEMRSVGIGFIIADQSAKNIPRKISEVCATKVFLGSSTFSGIDLYADTLKTDQTTLDHLYLLKEGAGVWLTYGMSTGSFFYSPNIIDQYRIEEEYPITNGYNDRNPSWFYHTFAECAICKSQKICTIESKQKARQMAEKLLIDCKPDLISAIKTACQGKDEFLIRCLISIIKRLKDMDYGICLQECALYQLFRQFNRESELSLENKWLEAARKNLYSMKDN